MEEDIENLTYEAHHKVDALIDLLIKKGIISEKEYEDQVEKLIDELEKNQ